VIAAVAEIVADVAGLAALWQENPALQQRLHRSQPSHLRAHPR
jgi:hypothetical protein